ncbi:hypothetical protein E1A91_A11G226800v1 [Gossypium mustelinum]|uniref:Uncharacterized protein n=1 Tax=Gossypium mustelinum TaxID=34275 RepID=A0A5D2XA08_GOSMU|nr:hypothetical protein E1A91_A11G226800v1 [Gossypium mustelinum]
MVRQDYGSWVNSLMARVSLKPFPSCSQIGNAWKMTRSGMAEDKKSKLKCCSSNPGRQ